MHRQSPHHVANFVVVHGMTEGEQRKINRETGPRKDIILVAERERQVLDSVPISHRENLEKHVEEYRDIFPEKQPTGCTSFTGSTTSYRN